MKRICFLLAIVVMQTFCCNAQHKDLPYVILISFDGFRYDYVERYNLPNFKALIKEGVAAEALIPSFPSKTFPNHYSIVTGLYPGNHGLVDNHFYDPNAKEVYSMRNRKTVTDSTYYGGVPLWQLARRNGVKSAAYFWIGSELTSEALRPNYYLQYDESVPFQERTEQVISWLKLPESERPHMITLYFSSPDTESHNHGPFAPETKAILFSLDSLLGNFMRDIKSLRLPVNVVIVSDHGMKELVEQPESYIFIDELVKDWKESVTVVNGGTQAHLYTRSEEQTDSLYNFLSKAAQNNFTVYKRDAYPARWHYDNDRSGDLLLVATPGKYIVTGEKSELLREIRNGAAFGAHGYDPYVTPDMKGIFYAWGPNIRKGLKIEAFQNIHIYPFIARLLNLPLPKIDGSPDVLKKIVKK